MEAAPTPPSRPRKRKLAGNEVELHAHVGSQHRGAIPSGAADGEEDAGSRDKQRRVDTSAQRPPLSDDDIASFKRDGFVLLPRVFSESTAQQCRDLLWGRLAQDGIERQDPSTWVERHGVPEIYTAQDAPVWGQVVTRRLTEAMDQLCGVGRWEDFGCGWWMITFPEQAEPPWEAAGKWHVDGAAYQHHVDSRESGLLLVFLFSDIAPGEGGTALSAGSHKRIAQLLEKNEPRGMKGGAVSFHARQFRRDRVVEVNGKAGDVMLVHPFLLHARSKNLGRKGVDSVRIMCNPNVRLHHKMSLQRPDGDYSPVEQAIVDALQESSSRPRK